MSNLRETNYALETGGNLASIKAKTDNLDVALSTRLKPADTLAAVTSITNPVAVTNANLDAKLSDIKANQTNGSQKVYLVDDTNASIESYADVTGGKHLGVSMIQSVYAVAQNSSTTNLAGGATFTGTSVTTLGANAIQVSLKTDVNCTVYIDQSPDGTNWDIVDIFNYYYSTNNFSTTVQTVNSYFRVRVKNVDAATSTYFRLQSVLCPVVEALPRALDENGHLLTAVHVIQDDYGFRVENTPIGEMRTIIPTLLVGKIFEGTTLDPNFWLATVANAGTVTTANAECVLATNTTANGSAKLNSVRRARYLPGQSMVARFQAQLNNTGTANNVRLWGIAWGATMPTITDGAYFKLSGTTFSVATLKGGSETLVSSGSFNGSYGAIYALTTNVTTCEIYWNNKTVYFVVNDRILHTVSASAATWCATMQHHIYAESTNSAGITSNNTLSLRIAGIRRLGPLLSQPTSKYQAGTVAALVLKYGLGNLHGVSISGVANNSVVTLYDNTAASGTILWSSGAMSANATPFAIPLHGLPFFTGLTLAITAANSNCTVIYE